MNSILTSERIRLSSSSCLNFLTSWEQQYNCWTSFPRMLPTIQRDFLPFPSLSKCFTSRIKSPPDAAFIKQTSSVFSEIIGFLCLSYDLLEKFYSLGQLFLFPYFFFSIWHNSFISTTSLLSKTISTILGIQYIILVKSSYPYSGER